MPVLRTRIATWVLGICGVVSLAVGIAALIFNLDFANQGLVSVGGLLPPVCLAAVSVLLVVVNRPRLSISGLLGLIFLALLALSGLATVLDGVQTQLTLSDVAFLITSSLVPYLAGALGIACIVRAAQGLTAAHAT